MSGMVSFFNVGRLGNWLFESAAAMAYAWENGMGFSAPTTARPGCPVYMPHLVSQHFDPHLGRIILKEQGHGWNPLHFSEDWRGRNIILDGYFQNEKYFEHCSERIIKEFGFEWHLIPGVISVHVRRGDYLTIKRGDVFKHPPVSKEWYERAMAKFPGFGFKFFSDEISWCKEQFGHRSDCTFSEGRNEVEDLVDGSHCEHHISSASTFGWWMSYLGRNENKKVIMPVNWLTPGWGNLDTTQVVPNRWEKLA